MTTTKPLPPGNLGLPPIGESISYFRDPVGFVQQRQQRYGQIFKTHLFGSPAIFMIGAEANNFLFTNENNYFSDGIANSAPPTTTTLIGKGSLIIKTGDEHIKARKLLSQAFQPRTLAGYTDTMEEITQRYLQKWERMGTFDWYSELRKYTLDVACKLLVGKEAASETQFGQWYQTWSQGMLAIPLSLPWTKYGRALRDRQKLQAGIEEIILERQQQSADSTDVLGILLQARDEEGNSLSLQDLKDELLTLLFAGHDTLSSALTSFCLLTAQHPEVLSALYEEQQQLGLRSPLTQENLKQMTYLEQVIKEVLRIFPPNTGPRKVIKSCEFNGYLIPQGWNIFYDINATHQDTNIYTQPESFDPNRFARDRAEDKQQTFGYIPFAGGMRKCLGMEYAKLEIKLFAALCIRDYQWELLPGQNLDLVRIPTIHPRNGLKVKFLRRT